MTDWQSLGGSIEGFEDWAKKVHAYHALDALLRYKSLLETQRQKVQAHEEKRGTDERA